MGEKGRRSGKPGGAPKRADCLALIGFMGAGKSAVGALLAKSLQIGFVDLDEVIAREAGVGIEDIFACEGEDGFRRRESAALSEQLDAAGAKVISCGGGIVVRARNVDMLRRRCRVFLLEISLTTAVERLRGSDGRPLLGGEDIEVAAARLMEEREHLYRRAAHESVDANEKSPRELAEEIAARWKKYESGSREGNTRSM